MAPLLHWIRTLGAGSLTYPLCSQALHTECDSQGVGSGAGPLGFLPGSATHWPARGGLGWLPQDLHLQNEGGHSCHLWTL